MPTEVEIPDIGVVEFPDEMSPEQIHQAATQLFQQSTRRAPEPAGGMAPTPAPAPAPVVEQPGRMATAFGQLVRATTSLATGPLNMAAGVADYIGEKFPSLDEGLPREQLYTARAARAIEGAVEQAFPVNPATANEFWSGQVPAGVGYMLGLLGGGGVAKLGAKALGKSGAAGTKAALGTAASLGYAAEFNDAWDRSQTRGDSPDAKLAKSLGYATVATLTENILGAGRLLEKYFPNVSEAVVELSRRGVTHQIVKDLAAGFGEEALQRAAQDLIVDGRLDPEAIRQEGLVGAVVQGLVGLPGNVFRPKAGPETKADDPNNELPAEPVAPAERGVIARGDFIEPTPENLARVEQAQPAPDPMQPVATPAAVVNVDVARELERAMREKQIYERGKEEIEYSPGDTGSSATVELEREEATRVAGERYQREKRRQAALKAAREADGDRPYDLIDLVEAEVGAIDPAILREQDPDWEPQGSAKKLFKRGGRPADVALDSLRGKLGIGPETPLDELGHLLNEAAGARREWRATRKAEADYAKALVKETEAQLAQQAEVDKAPPDMDIPFSLESSPATPESADSELGGRFVDRMSAAGFDVRTPRRVERDGSGSGGDFLATVGDVFGRKVFLFDGEAKAPQGLIFEEQPDSIFLKQGSGQSPFIVLGHELVETMVSGDPELYRDFHTAMAPLLQQTEQYQQRLNQRRAGAGSGLGPVGLDYATKELIADLVGNRFTERKFWDQLAEEAPGVFHRVAAAARALIDKLLEALTGRKYPVDHHLRDLRKARQVIAAAMAKHAQRRGMGGAMGAAFSLEDSDYLAAVEAGDMETAQRMVDAAARKSLPSLTPGDVFDYRGEPATVSEDGSRLLPMNDPVDWAERPRTLRKLLEKARNAEAEAEAEMVLSAEEYDPETKAELKRSDREHESELQLRAAVFKQLLEAKDQEQRQASAGQLGKYWQALARHDELFQYGRSASKSAAEIAKAVSVPGRSVAVRDDGDTIRFTGRDGYLEIRKADTARPYIRADRAGSRGKQSGGGSQLYAAALDWIHNNGKRIADDPSGLSAINMVRRTSNFLASALRWGTTRHLKPHVDQKVGKWTKSDSLNTALLADREAQNVLHAVPESWKWGFDFESGVFHKDGKPADENALFKDIQAADPEKTGVGFSTLQRAIITASAIAKISGGSSAAALDAVVLPSGLRGVSYSLEEESGKEREFAPRVDAAEDVPAGIRQGFHNRTYEVRSNQRDADFAARFIASQGGPEAVAKDFKELTAPVTGAERMLIGQLIVKQIADRSNQARAAGDAKQAELLDREATAFLDDHLLPMTTDVAQALQALKAWFALSPSGMIEWARRRVDGARQGLIKPHVGALTEAMGTLNAINTEGVNLAVGDKGVQDAAGQVIDASILEQARKTGRLNAALLEESVEALLANGYLIAPEAQVLRDHYAGKEPGTPLGDKLLRAGSKLTAKAVEKELQAEHERLRKRIRRRLINLRKFVATNPNGDPTDKLDRLLLDMLKQQRVKLGKLVREHYTQTDKVAGDLGKAMVEAGFTSGPLEDLTRRLKARFRAAVEGEKRRQLARLERPLKAAGIAKPDFAARMLELSNMGALDSERYWKAVQDRLKLPTWSADLAAEVKQQVESLHRIPEDQVERRQKAYTHFLRLLERQKGIDLMELGIGFFITNALTGPTTHMANMISTYLNTGAAFAGEAITALREGRAADIPLLIEGAGRGVKLAKESARDVMESGIVTGSRSQKAEAGVLFEQLRFGHKGGVPMRHDGPAPVRMLSRTMQTALETWPARVLNLWKYNYRLMGAQDMIAFKPAEEVKAIMLAAAVARQEGLQGEAIKERARQIIGYGHDQVKAAHIEAKAEGLVGSAYKRRVAEILNRHRSEKLKEDARQFALRTTFNNDPYGVMGWVAQWINRGKRHEDPRIRGAFTFIAPFTNIVANVTNESLNYSPVGFWRAKPGREHIYGIGKGEVDPAQWRNLRAEMQAKAFLGTAMWTALGVMAAVFLDDDDPELAVYAEGPTDGADRSGWIAAGGRPWSIKVGSTYYGYAHSPMQVPLGFLGALMDKRRDASIYQSRAAQREQQTLASAFAAGAQSMARVITEQSFLSGITDIFRVISGGPGQNAKSLERLVARSATSLVVPNALRQIDKFFDAKSYQAEDFGGMVVSQIPFARRNGKPALNALGLPVEWGLFDRFAHGATPDPVVQSIARKGAWPGLPNRHQIYSRTGTTMTDDDYYSYVEQSGATAYKALASPTMQRRIERADPIEAAKMVRSIVYEARQKARRKLGYE